MIIKINCHHGIAAAQWAAVRRHVLLFYRALSGVDIEFGERGFLQLALRNNKSF